MTPDEVEQYRHECECREWLARIRAKKPRSFAEGNRMLDELIEGITLARGAKAAQRVKIGILNERERK